MPTISMFYGIIIRMYYAPKEHNPPHFHIYFQDFKAIIDINTCSKIDGELPRRQLRMVEAWPKFIKKNYWQTGIFVNLVKSLTASNL